MNLENSIISRYGNQYWVFMLVLVFLTLFMMFCNGLSASYSGFDFFFHYRRLDVLIDALKHGDYISYIDYSNVDGYGYLVKPFYPDLILLPFAFIGLFTSTYFAYDTMIFVMTVLCGMFMYHTIKVIFNSRYAAFLGAILYTFAVYRLYDIYHRGALAEALSFSFLPIVFLGLYYVIKGDYRKWYILAIGYTSLIYSHVIASVLMFVTLLILLAINYKSFISEPKRITYLFLAGVVTLLLTSYYILPLVEQISHNSFYLDSRNPGGGAGYGKVGFDLILWGLVSGIAYPDTHMWTGVGIVLVLVLLVRFFVKKEQSGLLRMVDIGVIIGICFILITSRIFPWGRFPFNLLSFIQYPWRLYEFVSFFFAIAGAYYLSVLFVKEKQRFLVSAILVLVIMGTTYIHSENFKELYPQKTTLTDTGESPEKPTMYNRYHTIGGEYFPSKYPMMEYAYTRGEVVTFLNEDTKISDIDRGYNQTSFDVSINKPDTLVLPLLFYKGYNVTLRGIDIPIHESNDGLIEIYVVESGNINAIYKSTTIQDVSFYVSLSGAILLIIFVILNRNRKYGFYRQNNK
ncbi:hypothetical protein [Dysgonomonas sp. Marseille-P4361]|uniref:hypothetical protein n=1 Tax=Dysgonomonas sp. Marseille-P4361 TaxID=2161820 RepID=UPI0013575C05|nr:hypothetical protein [Dysgonomonas sp. Marseille-P4361]